MVIAKSLCLAGSYHDHEPRLTVDQSALFLSQVFPMSAPLPVSGPLDCCSSDRIEMNVTDQFQKIAIPFAYDRLVGPLKQMPSATVDLL